LNADALADSDNNNLTYRYGFKLLYGASMVFAPDADEEDTLLALSGKKSIVHDFFPGKSKEV